MALRLSRVARLGGGVLVVLAACGSPRHGSGPDADGDNVADDLGVVVDADHDNLADGIDINHDGKIDGPGVDTNHDGAVDALALDTDCDGLFDSLDTNGDGKPDWVTGSITPATNVAGCFLNPLDSGSNAGAGGGGTGAGGGSSGGAGGGGSTANHGGASGSAARGGSAGAGGASAGGAVGAGGKAGTAGTGAGGGAGGVATELGKGVYQGTGESNDQFAESDIFRNGVGYKFIANGWGSGWKDHDISWNGTSFTVASLNGNQGANYSPAGYPSVFCGLYSKKPSAGSCGLPASVASLKSVKTGWRWASSGSGGQYNAAWDIWLGNGDNLSSYLMVWLRDPPGQQPAGAAAIAGAVVPGLPGTWTIWTGNVNDHPIVNYVRAEGQDLSELEFDVLDVYRDAQNRKLNLPGSNLIAVAVGFEVWNGPIAGLKSNDFYVSVK